MLTEKNTFPKKQYGFFTSLWYGKRLYFSPSFFEPFTLIHARNIKAKFMPVLPVLPVLRQNICWHLTGNTFVADGKNQYEINLFPLLARVFFYLSDYLKTFISRIIISKLLQLIFIWMDLVLHSISTNLIHTFNMTKPFGDSLKLAVVTAKVL